MKENMKKIQYYLPADLRGILDKFMQKSTDIIHEIRLRSGQPLSILISGKNLFLTPQGDITTSSAMGFLISPQTIHEIFLLACKNSVYAYSEQLKNGFLTLQGGNRMAVAGRVVYENGRISTIQNITSLSIRIASECKGCSRKVMPYVVQDGQIQSCAIISPPGGGKTTMLRDIARGLSLYGHTVSIIDERGEIAGMNQGVPSYDLGSFCDVLDGCKKKDGLMLALRGLSPNVMIVDELGSAEEAQAVKEGINGGVATIFSIHASTLLQAVHREPMMYLLKQNTLNLLVMLSGAGSPGKVCRIYNLRNREDAMYVKDLWNSSA